MTFSYSRDGEMYTGSFQTAEAAAVEAFTDDVDLETVWIGENEYKTAHEYVSGLSVLEDVAQRAYDNSGECSEDWLSGLVRDDGKCAELEKMIGDWIEANERPDFWTITNARKVTRAETVAAGHLAGANELNSPAPKAARSDA